MSKSRRRPRHRRSHRATRVAAPVVVGGVVAAAAFGASPLADHLRPGGPARTTDAGGATGGPSPAVVLAQPVGTAATLSAQGPFETLQERGERRRTLAHPMKLFSCIVICLLFEFARISRL